LAFCLLIVSIFAAVYRVRVSPAFTMFFVTIALSMLYVLLGLFTDQVLVLRLLEVAVGGTMGALAAIFVLPIRTSRVVLNIVLEALQRLDDLVGSAVDRLSGNTAADPLQASRKFDEALQSLRTQIEPLLGTPGLASNATTRVRLTLLAACGYYGASLARLAYEGPENCPTDALQKAREEIHREIARIITLRERKPLEARQGRVDTLPPPDERALTYLSRIYRALRGLERSLILAT